MSDELTKVMVDAIERNLDDKDSCCFKPITEADMGAPHAVVLNDDGTIKKRLDFDGPMPDSVEVVAKQNPMWLYEPYSVSVHHDGGVEELVVLAKTASQATSYCEKRFPRSKVHSVRFLGKLICVEDPIVGPGVVIHGSTVAVDSVRASKLAGTDR